MIHAEDAFRGCVVPDEVLNELAILYRCHTWRTPRFAHAGAWQHGGFQFFSPSAYPCSVPRSTDAHAAAMCGYCDASARIKFDHAQFAALFNESQARGDKQKLMQLFGA